MKIHTVIIAYKDPPRARMRWMRDVLPGLHHLGCERAVTCVDNSPTPSEILQETFGEDYLWQEGRNLMYGPSINLAVPRIPSDLILYVCAQHGKMHHPAWVEDLARPFDNPKVGMTGYLMGSNSPEGVAHVTHCPWVKDKYTFTNEGGQGYVPQHVQGGVFMARTSAMLEHPYPPEIPHLYTDHIVTWAMMKAGWECVNVPSVVSVWRDRVPRHKLEGVKYVHDCSEE